MSEWISVKERLPEQSGLVLIARDRPNPMILGTSRERVVSAWFIIRKGIFVSDDGAVGYDATHWMPLPAPPSPSSGREGASE